MHEVAIAESVLKVAQNRLNNTDGADSVLTIRVEIGEFRNVDLESLTFAFDNIKGFFSGCADSTIDALIIPAFAFCSKSKHHYRLQAEDAYRCPQCHAGIGVLESGEELNVTKISLQKLS